MQTTSASSRRNTKPSEIAGAWRVLPSTRAFANCLKPSAAARDQHQFAFHVGDHQFPVSQNAVALAESHLFPQQLSGSRIHARQIRNWSRASDVIEAKQQLAG